MPRSVDLVARGVGAVVAVRAHPLRLRPGREQPQQPGAQPHGAAEEPPLEPARDRVAEGAQQRLVHQRVGEPLHHPLRCPAVRRERRHQVEGRVGDPAAARVEGEVLALVVVEQLLEPGEVLGHVLDGHVPAELDVVVRGGRDLVGRQGSEAVVVHPPLRDHDEGGQHVAEVLVADVVHRVHLVDPAYGGPAAAGCRSRAAAPPRAAARCRRTASARGGELAGLVEQPTDGRNRVGPEQGERQRLEVVPREVVGRDVQADLVAVADRVELLAAPGPVVAGQHRVTPSRRRR